MSEDLSAEYYYAVGKRRRGPVGMCDLQNLALTGDLGRNDKVWSKGMDKWARAGDVAEIFVDLPPDLEAPSEAPESSVPKRSSEHHPPSAGGYSGVPPVGYVLSYFGLACIGWLAWIALKHGGAERYFREPGLMQTLVFVSTVLPTPYIYWWFLPDSGDLAKDSARNASIAVFICEEIAIMCLFVLEADDPSGFMSEMLRSDRLAAIWCLLAGFPLAIVYPLAYGFFELVGRCRPAHASKASSADESE